MYVCLLMDVKVNIENSCSVGRIMIAVGQGGECLFRWRKMHNSNSSSEENQGDIHSQGETCREIMTFYSSIRF